MITHTTSFKEFIEKKKTNVLEILKVYYFFKLPAEKECCITILMDSTFDLKSE